MAGSAAFEFENEMDLTEQAIKDLVSRLADELEITSQLQGLETRAGVRLTPSAYLMLLVPAFEARQLRARRRSRGIRYLAGDLDPLEVSKATTLQSIYTLAREARSNPASADRVDEAAYSDPDMPLRTAFSVIKSFWKRFCNIPPFCGEAK